MTKYLVLKRANVGWGVVPGELVKDPPNADRLVVMGYLLPVADNYKGEVSTAPEVVEVPTEEVTDETTPSTESTAEAINALTETQTTEPADSVSPSAEDAGSTTSSEGESASSPSDEGIESTPVGDGAVEGDDSGQNPS